MSADSSEKICVGVVTGARGIKGELRVKSFTADPDAIFAYGPVSDERGTQIFEGRVSGKAKDHLLVFLKGVTDRNRADELKGTRLYVDRDALPAPEEDEFYHADLIGLAVELKDGGAYGNVRGVLDVGGGASLEIASPDGIIMMPFTKQAVPAVDIANGKMIVDPPEGLLDDPDEEDDEEERNAKDR